MPDKNKKHPKNVNGKYYVDDKCVHCEACIMEAPETFDLSSQSFVKKQPADELEIEMAETARSVCPVEAIGNDGDD